LLPELAVGLELGVEAKPPSWPALRLRAAGFLPRETSVERTGGAVRFLTGYVGLGLCPALGSTERLSVDACLGADVVWVRAVPRRLDALQTSSRARAQAALGLRGSWELDSRISIRGSVMLLPSASSDRYVVEHPDGSETLVFQREPFSWTVGLGVALALGPH
jgi:hypothetical protein